MKNLIIVTLLTGFVIAAVHAQDSQGVIIYETMSNMHRSLPAERQEMKKMVPEYRSTMDQLFFNAAESLYKPVEEESDLEAEHGDSRRMRFRRPQTEVYIRSGDSRRIVLHEFMGKKYLVEDSLRIHPWRITDEFKEISGYTCRKATLTDEEDRIKVVAWYSEQFRPFLGPQNYHTLPGAALLVDINDGERIITARTIELRPLKKNEIRIPDAKTRITEEAYRKLVNEQTERMRANGGNMNIRH